MSDHPDAPIPSSPPTMTPAPWSRQLLALGHAALAWTDPDTGTPGISRIAFARDPEAGLLTLVSGLAPHFRALRDRPDCALMLGEVGEKGDPLTHPRLMIRAHAASSPPMTPPAPASATAGWPGTPRPAIYIDLPDFAFVRLTPISALLNGGFARAFPLPPEDLQQRAAPQDRPIPSEIVPDRTNSGTRQSGRHVHPHRDHAPCPSPPRPSAAAPRCRRAPCPAAT